MLNEAVSPQYFYTVPLQNKSLLILFMVQNLNSYFELPKGGALIYNFILWSKSSLQPCTPHLWYNITLIGVYCSRHSHVNVCAETISAYIIIYVLTILQFF